MSSISESKQSKKHVVVVLGMHRSGTSLLTRGLEVLGVDLGANLYGGVVGNNDKGFFEDIDVNGFNVELLQALGRDWHSIEPVLPEELNRQVIQEFKLKAIELIRSKINNVQCFGLKDPRIARLLPFWVSVFEHLKVKVSYIIAFRNPMSVARSLQKRDGFDLEKGYLLWAEHMLGSLRNTQGRERLVVEYDRLMADPGKELRRIADACHLKFDSTSQEFVEYQMEFLDSSLRHTQYQAEDLLLDQAVPAGTVELYKLLVELSDDSSNIDAPENQHTLNELVERLRNCHELLRYLSQKDMALSALTHMVSENKGRLVDLQQTIAMHETNIDNLNKAITQRDGQIASLSDTVSQHENNISVIDQAVLARDEKIALLNQAVADSGKERDSTVKEMASLEHQLNLALMELTNLQSELALRAKDVERKQELLDKSIENNTVLDLRLAQCNSALENIVTQRAGLENSLLQLQVQLESVKTEKEALVAANIAYEDQMKVSGSEIECLAANNSDLEQKVSSLSSDVENVVSHRDGLLLEVEGLRIELSEMQLINQGRMAEVESLEDMIEKNSREYMENMNVIEKLLAENERLNNERYMAKVADLESAVEQSNHEYLNSVNVSAELLKENKNLNAEVLARTQHVIHLESACAGFKQEISDLESKVYYAWQEIESVKNANAEIRYHNEKILNSSSWYLTAPLRFFRLNFMTKPYRLIKKAIAQTGRGIWRSLPISTQGRMACKNVLYKTLPFAFKNSERYQQWLFYIESQKKNLERKNHSFEPQLELPVSSSVQVVAEIPRIQFDSTQNQFVEHRDNPKIDPVVKLIAFYLPQFHPFPENDAWWGKGFTEWTNVTKAYPNYVEHYQPHYPIHMGYYDLRVAEAMEEQARLAKEYGIYGFSYYFYWFAGKILMDTPLEQMLENPKVEMPFCFTWANENWSRRWDGQENDILIAQNHSDEDSLEFIRHLMKYFKDKRYIKIDGKPLLIIYRASIIPNMEQTADIWREELEKNGFPGLYLVCAQSFGIKSPVEFGFDASVEFPPHTVSSTDIRHELNMTNSDFNGHVFSYEQVVANAVASKEPAYKLFRAAMLSWDNTARKQNNSHIFHGFSLLRYKQWLSSITNNVFNNAKYSNDEKIVFVNAWNEWAEGTHLEPDRKFGYGYLQATYDVLAEYDISKVSRLTHKRFVRENDCAVVLHLHYEELWGDIKGYLDSLADIGFDLYVTVTSSTAGVNVAKDYPDAHIELVENRGRDILPFLGILRTIKDMGYVAVCKIHSKRSVYRMDGDRIRDELLDALLGSSAVASEILKRFSNKPELGLIAAEKYLIAHTDHNMTFSGESVSTLSTKLELDFSYDEFAAGSMFWFKPQALELILSIDESMFEVEDGLADGTLAHGVERVICSVVKNAKYSVETV